LLARFGGEALVRCECAPHLHHPPIFLG
jgi:hypothetical protein